MKNDFNYFFKNEISFSKTKIIYAIKMTIAASIGGAIAFYLSYYKQIGLGWWICSSIFTVPSITLAASLKKGIQRINATFLGCFFGLIISYIIGKNSILFVVFAFISIFIWCTLSAGSKKFNSHYFLAGILCLMIIGTSFSKKETPIYITSARIIDTLLGVIIALLVFYFLWPKRQKIVWQVQEHGTMIIKNLAIIYKEKLQSLLLAKEVNISKMRRIEISVIDEFSLLKQFQDDVKMEFFDQDKKLNLINKTLSYYEELFMLIKSLPLYSISEGKSLIHSPKIYSLLQQLCPIISTSIEKNEYDVNCEFIFSEIKLQIEKSILDQEHLKYNVLSNLEFYSFVHNSEKIIKKINQYEKNISNELYRNYQK